MEKCKIFYIEFKSEKKYFLIDVAMNDELRSHRYYILKYLPGGEYEYFRIKNIDSLLHLLEKNGISLKNLDDDNQDASKKKIEQDNDKTLEEQISDNILLTQLGSYDFKVLEKIKLNPDFDGNRRTNL